MPNNWQVLFEYPLLRLGKRLEVVLVTDRAIFVMEFKATKFDKTSRIQAEDYALDLRDFHAGSRRHPIIPILIATNAPPAPPVWPLFWNNYDNPLFEASATTLPNLMSEIIPKIDHRGVDIAGWEHATYQPVPTIVEAAVMLYRKHGVAEIKSARAGISNLTLTTDALLEAINYAKISNSHVIIFVTGIPGAGKTLCGLNVVFSPETDAAFLTGTLPMVYVLNEALAIHAASGIRKSKYNARRKTKGKIQSITRFLKDNRDRTDAPAEPVIVFDEAQCAWNAKYGAQKFGLPDSEAAIVLDIMQRHKDYAVIIGLVGNGQEINNGEAGLSEWGRALSSRPEWKIRAAPNVIKAAEPRQCLYETTPDGLVIDPILHLNVPIRQIRSAAGAPWVDAILRGAQTEAAEIAQEESLAFFVVRSLATLRNGLHMRATGLRRAGLVCSSVRNGSWPKVSGQNSIISMTAL